MAASPMTSTPIIMLTPGIDFEYCNCAECQRKDAENRVDDPDTETYGMRHDFGMYCTCADCDPHPC